ncbi:MAG: hypothetical protein OXI52_08725 [Caldilineaceae bacterium]|nr:hypothetical protein [Caldilineaceae bacterium]
MRGSSSILDTFPIVRRPDQAAFGRNCTKMKILAYDNTLAVAPGPITRKG